MLKGKGYSGGMYGGSTKSTARNAPMDNKGGNYGKPMGDTGTKSKKGNRRTRQAADRYK